MCQKDQASRREILKLVLDYIKKEELNDVEDGVNIVYRKPHVSLSHHNGTSERLGSVPVSCSSYSCTTGQSQ
jgi:hypothetical protein